MTFQQELASWMSPSSVPTAPAPTVGSRAPNTPKLRLPAADGRPTMITFLRHCGCPFAEKAFVHFRKLANKHPEANFVAVSHSSQEATDKWSTEVGGHWDVAVIVDPERELYAAWGLGISSTWHVLNPWSLYNVYKLATHDKIVNRATESGSRWQMSGSFAVDKDGIVRWTQIAKAADDFPDFKAALQTVVPEEKEEEEEDEDGDM